MFDGVAVLTTQGKCAYQYGCLKNIPENNWQQFTGVFKYATPEHDDAVCARGFTISFTDVLRQFKICKKTLTSVYAVGGDNEMGLVVCSLPYGILLSTYSHPHVTEDVVRLVEDFCYQLRA